MFILQKVRERKQTSRWGLWFWTNEDRGENIWADCGDTSHRLSCTCGWWRRARRTGAACEGQQCRGTPHLAKAPTTIPLPTAASHQYAATKGTRQTPCPRRLLVHTAELQPGSKHTFYPCVGKLPPSGHLRPVTLFNPALQTLRTYINNR